MAASVADRLSVAIVDDSKPASSSVASSSSTSRPFENAEAKRAIDVTIYELNRRMRELESEMPRHSVRSRLGISTVKPASDDPQAKRPRVSEDSTTPFAESASATPSEAQPSKPLFRPISVSSTPSAPPSSSADSSSSTPAEPASTPSQTPKAEDIAKTRNRNVLSRVMGVLNARKLETKPDHVIKQEQAQKRLEEKAREEAEAEVREAAAKKEKAEAEIKVIQEKKSQLITSMKQVQEQLESIEKLSTLHTKSTPSISFMPVELLPEQKKVMDEQRVQSDKVQADLDTLYLRLAELGVKKPTSTSVSSSSNPSVVPPAAFSSSSSSSAPAPAGLVSSSTRRAERDAESRDRDRDRDRDRSRRDKEGGSSRSSHRGDDKRGDEKKELSSGRTISFGKSSSSSAPSSSSSSAPVTATLSSGRQISIGGNSHSHSHSSSHSASKDKKSVKDRLAPSAASLSSSSTRVVSVNVSKSSEMIDEAGSSAADRKRRRDEPQAEEVSGHTVISLVDDKVEA